jgi:hypothetical protein
MGSPVTLEIPVTPIALDGGAATHLTDVKVKLLHSLAARALIQDWEDKEKAEKNRAEIERLGKRYSLASSATSFLAIDDDTKKEIEKGEVHYQEPEPQVYSIIAPSSSARRSGPPAQFSKAHGAIYTASTAWTSGVGMGPAIPLLPPSYSFAAAMPPPPAPSARPVPPIPVPMQMGSMGGRLTSSSRAAYSSPVTPAGLPQDTMRSRSGAASQQLATPGATASVDRSLPEGYLMQSSCRKEPVPASFIWSHLSLLSPVFESYGGIARAQQFDGGFPVTSDFICLLTGSSSAPALPGELAVLSGSEQEKQIIWVTVLVLAVLAKKFAGDKDSWEMLAEKSTEFVETSLVSMGVDSGNAVTVINQLKSGCSKKRLIAMESMCTVLTNTYVILLSNSISFSVFAESRNQHRDITLCLLSSKSA